MKGIEYIMDNKIWQIISESIDEGWTEDSIFQLTGRGALYHCGGSDGKYISISENGLLSVGNYTEAFPHMGMASYTPEWSEKHESFDMAMKAAYQYGGEDFWDGIRSHEIGRYSGLAETDDFGLTDDEFLKYFGAEQQTEESNMSQSM